MISEEDQCIDVQLVEIGDYVFVVTGTVEEYPFPLSLGKVLSVVEGDEDTPKQLELHWQHPDTASYEGTWIPWNMRGEEKKKKASKGSKAPTGKAPVVAYTDFQPVDSNVRPIRVVVTGSKAKYNLSRSTLKQLLTDAEGAKLSHWKPLHVQLFIKICTYIYTLSVYIPIQSMFCQPGCLDST